MFRILLILLFLSCSRKGHITLGPGSELGVKAPSGTVTSMVVTADKLIINGVDFQNVTEVRIVSPTRDLVYEKEFNIISQSSTQIISEAVDALKIPVDVAFNLILGNAYGQSSIPIVFELPADSVETNELKDEAVTTAKIQDSAVTRLKLNKEPGDNPVNGAPLIWSTASNEFIFGLPGSGGGGGTSGVDAIQYGPGIVGAPNLATGMVSITVDTAKTGHASLRKIPFFTNQNQVELDGNSTPPAKLLLSHPSSKYTVFNDGDFVIREETPSPKDVFTIEVNRVSINEDLYVNNKLVCVEGSTCGGSGITSVTASAPLTASGTTSVVISAGAVNTANNLVKLDSSGKLPPGIGGVRGPATSGNGNIPRFSNTTGDQLADSGIHYQNIPTMADIAFFADSIILSGGPDKTLKGSPFTIPNTACPSGQILKSDGYNYICGDDLDSVTSVFGRAGAVVSVAGDYNASQVTFSPSGAISASNTQGAITELENEKLALAGGTMTGPIITTSQNSLQIGPSGGNTGETRYMEQSGAEYVGFKAPNSITTNIIWTLPASGGTDGQVLTTGVGNSLSWTSITGGSGGIGDVNGPASSTPGNLPVFADTSGKIISDSGIISNNLVTMAANGTGNYVLQSTTGLKTATESNVLASDIATMAQVATATNQLILSITGSKALSQSGYTVPSSVCPSGQVLKSDGTNLTCQDDLDTSAPVTSVFGRTGTIVSEAGDYSADLITNVASGTISSVDVQGAINELDSKKLALAGGTMTGPIITTSQNSLQIGPSGGNTGEMRYMEQSGAEYVGFKAPNSITTNIIWTLPATGGTNGQLLTTDGANSLSWVSISGDVTGPASSVSGNLPVFADNSGKKISDSGIPSADLITKTTVFSGSNRVALSGGNDRTLSETVYTIPPTDGLINQILKTNGVGAVSWQPDSGVIGSGITTNGNLAAWTSNDGSSLGDTTIIAADVMTMTANGIGNYVLQSTIGQKAATESNVLVSDIATMAQAATATNQLILSVSGTKALSKSGYTVPSSVCPSGQVLKSDGTNLTCQDDLDTSPPVTSVFGRIGDVVSEAGDYSADLITNIPSGSITATSTQGAIDELESNKLALVGGTMTGAIITTSQTALDLNSSAGNTGEIIFRENGNTNFVGFKAPAAIGSDVLWTLPASDGASGTMLTTNGSGNLSWKNISPGSDGIGDVVGPPSAVDSNLATFNGTTGKLVKDSGINSSTLAIMNSVATNANQLILSGGVNTELVATPYTVPNAIGAAGQVLTSSGTNATWENLPVTGDVFGPGFSTINQVAIFSDNSGKRLTNTPYTLPILNGTAGQVLTTDGVGTTSWAPVGNVTGAASSTAGNIPTFSDNSGKIIQDSNISASNILTMGTPATLPGQVILSTGPGKDTLVSAYTFPTTAGTAGQILRSNGIDVTWQDENTGGDVFGPAGSASGTLASYDGTTGKLIQDTGISSGDVMTMFAPATGGNILTSSGGKGAADSLVSISNVPTMAAPAASSNTVVLSNGNDKTLKTTPYTIPDSACTDGQILQADASGNLICADDVSGVTSFNTRVGDVMPTAGDYSAIQISSSPTLDVFATDVQGAINELDSKKLALTGGTMAGAIVTTSQSALDINSSGGNTGEVIFRANGNANFVGFKAPAAIGSNVLWTLPASDGASGTMLTTNGSGNLSWKNISPGSDGIGDVVGPSSAIDSNLAAFDGVNGKLIKDSQIPLANVPTMAAGATAPNRIIVSAGSDKTLVDSGVSSIDLITKVSDFTSANRIAISGGANRTLNETSYTIPATDGSATYVLKTDGAGSVTWQPDLDTTQGANDVQMAGTGIIGNVIISAGGKDIQDSNLAFSNISTMADNATDSYQPIVSAGPDKTQMSLGYKIPSTACSEGQTLQADSSGNLICADDVSGVTSFNTRFGAVVSVVGDYNGDQVTITPSGSIAATTTQGAINELDTSKLALSGGTMSGAITTTTPVALDIQTNGEIQFKDTDNSNYVGFKAPISINSNLTWTLPASDGSSGTVLTTDGLGILSWKTISGGLDGIGDVVGPPSSTQFAIATYSDNGGKKLSDTNVLISGTNDISGVAGFTSSGNMAVDGTTFFVDSAGDKVGIGNAAPIETLDVTGTARITSNTSIGGTLGISGQTTFNVGGTPSTFPTDQGTAGQVLSTNGLGTLSWVTNANGDVVGPAGSASGTLASYSGTTGKLIQDSGIFSSDLVTMTIPFNGSGRVVLSVDGTKTIDQTPYSIPTTACTLGQTLQADSSGNLVCATDVSGVTTFNTRTGDVIPLAGDYSAVQITSTPTGDISATEVQGALNELDSEKLALAGGNMTGTINSQTSTAVKVGPFAGDTGDIRFEDLTAGYIGFKAPISVTTNTIWTLPAGDGSSGTVLSTDGSGILSWQTISGGVGGIGNVVGPSSSTQFGIATYSDTGGKNLSDTNVTISGTNDIGGVAGFTSTGNMTVDGTTFFVDSTGDKVGIGNAAPVANLDVTGTAAISGNTTVGGTLGITGQTTFNVGGTSSTFPTDRGADGQVLSTNGGGALSWKTITGGSDGIGDVVGPAGSVSGTLASFGDTTGKIIQDTGIQSANIVTMGASSSAIGNILTSAGMDKSIMDSGLALSSIPTMAADATDTYQPIVSAGANKSQISVPYKIPITPCSDGQILEADVNGNFVCADNTGGVSSFNGRTGVVTSQTGDYSAVQITSTPTTNIIATDVQAALKELDDEKLPLAGGTMGGTIITTTATALDIQFSGGIHFRDTDNTNHVGFKAPISIDTDLTWTLPASDGASGTVLTTDGLGILSWKPISATGDVVGPPTSTTGNLPNFTDNTGKQIGDSGINSANVPTMAGIATAPNQIIISVGADKQLTTTLYPIPVTIGASGTVLTSDGANSLWQTPVVYVSGPASSTLNAITRFAGTNGQSLKDGPVIMDDSGNFNFLRAYSTTDASHPCPSMTVAQRNALTASDGDCIFNTESVKKNQWRLGRWSDITSKEVWQSGVAYKIGDLVENGFYLMRADTNFTSSSSVNTDFFNKDLSFTSVLPITTCVSSGGGVTLSGGNIDVISGQGIISANSVAAMTWPDITRVEWSGVNIAPLTTSDWNTISIDSTGTPQIVIGRPTANLLRTNIVLATVHPDLNIVRDFRGPCFDQGNTIRELNFMLGLLTKGFLYAGNANLTMNRGSGSLYGTGIDFGSQNPNIKDFTAVPTITISDYMTRNATISKDVTDLDVVNYDLNGTLTQITNNRWSYARIYLFGDGKTALQYGQTQYNSLNAAVQGIRNDAPFFVENANLSGVSQWVGSIVFLKSTPNLSNSSENAFINCGTFGCTGGGGGGGGGGGDVFGPTTSVLGNLASFTDTSGKVIEDSGISKANIPTMALPATSVNNVILSSSADKTLKTSAYTIPETICPSGQILKSDGTNFTCQTESGNVVGPASAIDNTIVRFDLTTGKLIQGSGVIIDDSNNMSGIINFTSTGNMSVAGTLGITGQTTFNVGTNSSTFPTTRGTNGQILTADGIGGLNWSTPLTGPGSTVIGNVVNWNNTTGTLTSDSGIASVNLVTNTANFTAAGNVVTALNNSSRGVTDSGIASANLVTMNVGGLIGNIISSAGGKGVQDSGILFSDVVTSTSSLSVNRVILGAGGTKAVTQTGYTIPTAIGTSGQVLKSDGTNATWQADSSANSVNVQTGTSYTVTAGDCANTITLNNAGAIAVTMPNVSVGCKVDLIQLGGGQVTVTGSGGVVVQNAFGLFKTRGQYSVITVHQLNATLAIVSGDVN